MRRRGRFGLHDAERLIAHRKRLGVTEDVMWKEAASTRGLDRGNGKEGWHVTVFAHVDGVVRAKLSVGTAPIEGLDFHRRPSPDLAGGVVAAGYHWDVFYPVRAKHSILDQPGTRSEILALIVVRWNLVIDPRVQGELLS